MEDLAIALDTFWVLFAACLVFFMQAGFAFLEAGLHSAKNAVHILMKNAGDFLIASLAFWAFGFAFMFGNGNAFIGLDGFFLNDDGSTFASLSWANVPLEAKFFFQLAFAGTAATIVSGAIGGRFRYSSYLLFSFLMTVLIYPIVGHWVWGGGWLSERGFFDFSGSSVVHQVGGWSALVGAYMVGPRLKRFDNRVVNPYPPHNMSLVVLGVFILWLGWFGFNPGSTMNISSSAQLVSHIVVTTNLGGVSGSLAAIIVAYFMTGRYDAGALFNGLIAGLVGITASCAFVGHVAAIAIGSVAGVLMIGGSLLIEKLEVDDAVGAWPVHALPGLWGTLALGLFASEPWSGGPAQPGLGLFYGGGFGQLGVQLLGALSIAVFTIISSTGVFWFIKITLGLRVSEQEEIEGADRYEHGYKAYLGLELPSLNRRQTDSPLLDERSRK